MLWDQEIKRNTRNQQDITGTVGQKQLNIYNKSMLKYKAVYGYKPGEYYQVQEEDLERVLYAHRYGKVVTINGNQISGRYIQRIEPDIHHYTGWNPDYTPRSLEDERQIRRDVPVAELNDRMKLAEKRVNYAVENNKIHQLKEPHLLINEAKHETTKDERSPSQREVFN